MKFTAKAWALLDTLPPSRQCEVGNLAKRLAYKAGKTWVGMEEITSAVLCAGPEFIDTPDKSHEGDNP